MNGSLMIRIEFSVPLNGFKSMVCKGISSDPMNDRMFIIQFANNEVLSVKVTNIKHISNYEK